MLILAACPPLDFTLLLEALSTQLSIPVPAVQMQALAAAWEKGTGNSPVPTTPQDRSTCKIIFLKSRNHFENLQLFLYRLHVL